MKKITYFIIQIIWSFLFVLITGILALTSIEVTPGTMYPEPGDLAPAGGWLLGGMLVYAILTIVYIVIGCKTVKKWRWWVILVSLVLSAVIGVLGFVFGL